MLSEFSKFAAGLSFIIGAMAVIAGGRVLLGHDPGYYVIDWLLVYNLIAGLVSATLTATLLWLNHRLASPLWWQPLACTALCCYYCWLRTGRLLPQTAWLP